MAFEVSSNRSHLGRWTEKGTWSSSDMLELQRLGGEWSGGTDRLKHCENNFQLFLYHWLCRIHCDLSWDWYWLMVQWPNSWPKFLRIGHIQTGPTAVGLPEERGNHRGNEQKKINSCYFTPKQHQKWSQKVWIKNFPGGAFPKIPLAGMLHALYYASPSIAIKRTLKNPFQKSYIHHCISVTFFLVHACAVVYRCMWMSVAYQECYEV